MTERIALNEKVLANLAARGEAGTLWHKTLPETLRRLEAEWRIRVGRTFPNATEAFAAEAVAEDGTLLALKVPIVGLPKGDREALLLLAAGGRGYVRLIQYDTASGAMLLERLGTQLARQGFDIDAQIPILCSTLRRAWALAVPGLRLPTGAEKAREMAAYIAAVWPKLGEPCSERTARVAIRYAERRADAFDPANCVIGHGDAHAWNTLHDPSTGEYKLVDPDGLFAEPAHDLSISMREWSAELLAGDAAALGRKRCALLSRLSGVDDEAIWQWGCVERLVNGLQYLEVGPKENAHQFLAVAEAWAAAEDA